MTECYACAKLAELRAENSQLRVKVDELANGNDGETNVITSGSPLVDELPNGDAPSEFAEILMALAADCSCMGDGIVRHFEPKDVQGDVDALMRVVERDYVRRAAYNSLKELTTNSDKWLKGKLEEARAERDEWKAKALGYEHRINLELLCSDKSIIDALESRNRELTAERDKWKAKAETRDDGVDCGHLADMSAKDAYCVRDGGEMSDVDSRDNGWYLRYDGYMTSKSNYLRISGFKAARALDNRQNLVFVKFMGGKEADCRVYAPKLDVCENLHDSSKETQKPRSRESDSGNVSDSDGESLHVEQDTREKLEADAQKVLEHEVDRLTRENISLARDLGECMAERDSWRYRWHQVRVLMDEPLQCDRATLVDIDGEVAG